MNEQNYPYEPPKSELKQDLIPLETMPASRWLRLANLLVDYLGFIGLAVLVGVIVGVVGGDAGIQILETIPDFVLGAPIYLGYYFMCEALTGRTLGKLITGTRVVNEEGLPASTGQIFGRSLARLIPFEAFSFFGTEGRGWHDRMPGTYVVKCR